ncbi:Alcohol acetyltransferase protein [Rutstroemia sp. NJR-2017a BVV2]|nr:Alcohol acetyltransferase protein [Rutstroemia sp. NJR-2017a BVV2]
MREAYQLAMYTLDQYRGTSVACRYAIPSKFAHQESHADLMRIVNAAVAEAILKHPVLQVGIIEAESTRPMWVQLQRIDIDQHVTWHSLDASIDFDNTSQKLTASEVDGKFSELEVRSGWGLLILYQETTSTMEINFTWNHPHADGVSGKIFQEDLCQSLNTQTLHERKTQQQSGSFSVELPRDPQLPPPIEELCKLPLSLGYMAKMAWAEFGPTSFAWTRPCLAKWAPFQLSPYQTQFRAFIHKTTLTGLLHGLALVSIASQLDQETAPAFESGTTMDMRRFLPANPAAYPWLQPTRTMGNYVTLITHQFDGSLVSQIRSPISSKDKTLPLPVDLIQQVWSISARVRSEIKQKLNMGLKNDPVGVMKLVKD